MKASVSLLTYNHAPHIRQAIESVLEQKTNFEFELLIGEDDSTDGTREIVREYGARYPGKIRLFLHRREDVLYIKGRPTGRRNFVNNLRNARGEYVALLDGDDYWTSPLKLQKQVDFLDRNRDCALCFHNVRIQDESDPEHPVLHHTGPMRERYALEDLLAGNFLQTCSVMFRAGLFGKFPHWYFRCPLGDWPLQVLNAQHGRIGYLDEVMAVYREHGGGVWSGQAPTELLAKTIQTAECIRTGLTRAQCRHLDTCIERCYLEILHLCSAAGDYQAAHQYAADYFKSFIFRGKVSPWHLLRTLMRSRSPAGCESFIDRTRAPRTTRS